MQINLTEILVTATAVYAFIKHWYGVIEKIITPVIQQVETLAKDGKIDKDDRKKVALAIIAEMEKSGQLKLSFFQRMALNWIVDWVAKKLPDFTVSTELGTSGVVAKVLKTMK